MPFLKNAWYAAATEGEIADGKVVQRKLLGEEVVMYRTLAGEIAAMTGICPHRFAPLGMARREGDVLECGYHGLKFGPDGSCVHNPRGDGKVTERLKLRFYPAILRHRLLWLWMGDPAHADPASIPDFSIAETAPEAAICEGYIPTAADYRLVFDNLMDATHADFVHPDTLSTGGAFSSFPPQVEQTAQGVRALFRFDGKPAQALYARHLPDPAGPATQEIFFQWVAPSNVLIGADVWQDNADAERLSVRALHALTPETESATHYWFVSARNFGELSEEARAQRQAVTMHAFANEDKPMLEGVQKMMAGRDFWELHPAILAGDNAQILARRMLQKLVRQEQGETEIAVQ